MNFQTDVTTGSIPTAGSILPGICSTLTLHLEPAQEVSCLYLNRLPTSWSAYLSSSDPLHPTPLTIHANNYTHHSLPRHPPRDDGAPTLDIPVHEGVQRGKIGVIHNRRVHGDRELLLDHAEESSM